MASTTPTRFDAALFASAQAAGARTHRSATQQLAHWARLGRELEATAGLSQRDIDRVLAGQLSYDDLGDWEQTVVRTAWREGIDADLNTLDLAARFSAQARTRWSEADDAGRVTVHEAEAADEPPPSRSAQRRRGRSVRT